MTKKSELYDNQTKSEIDSIKTEVILGDIPSNISDLVFIKEFEKIGYKKNSIDKSKFKDIDKIFVEKSAEEKFVKAYIYVYRDILIFKKNNKVVGTAKICFDCSANEINGQMPIRRISDKTEIMKDLKKYYNSKPVTKKYWQNSGLMPNRTFCF